MTVVKNLRKVLKSLENVESQPVSSPFSLSMKTPHAHHRVSSAFKASLVATSRATRGGHGGSHLEVKSATSNTDCRATS